MSTKVLASDRYRTCGRCARIAGDAAGLTLVGNPWWPSGFNAYQLATDWSVNAGCGAMVDLDSYFSALEPGSLTRFNAFPGWR